MDEDNLNEQPILLKTGRARFKNLILGIVLLACGAAIGSVITAVVVDREPKHGFRRSEQLPELIAGRMKAKYGLTDDDEKRLHAIFEEHGKKLAGIRAEVQPRVTAEHEALQKAVETILTPEQAADWRKEFERMRSSWRSRSGETPNAANAR